jgi:putative tricarboxylic transport membrane protein
MKKWERVAAAVLMVAGIGAALEALKIGFGSFQAPGPGFYPFWLALILALIAGMLLGSRLGRDEKPAPLWLKGAWVRPLLAVMAMFGYALFLGWLGFCAATLMLFIVWMAVIERESWLRIGLVSVIGTGFVYLLFVVLLKVSLPKGILF